jgi:phosphomannomutase / phosphoglucomutase
MSYSCTCPNSLRKGIEAAACPRLGSPDHVAHCGNEVKYGVVDRVIAHFKGLAEHGEKLAGQPIRDDIMVNGIRIVLEGGT